MKLPILLILTVATAAQAQQSAHFLWQVSNDGIHWSSATWPTIDHTLHVRLVASWSSIPGGLGIASSEFDGTLLGNAVSVTNITRPFPFDSLAQNLVATPVASGTKIDDIADVMPPGAGSSWVKPVQAAPANNAAFSRANPAVIFSYSIPAATNPPQASIGMVLNGVTGRALKVYNSLNGSVSSVDDSVSTVTSASLFAATGGCTFLNHPVTQTRIAGDLFVLAAPYGSANASYQWTRNGADLSDDQHLSGSQTAFLRFSSVRVADAGAYECRVLACGGRTSNSAILTVLPCPPTWKQLSAGNFGSRAHHVQASTSDGKTLLFGGENNGVSLSDTWVLTDNLWVQHAVSGPSPRVDAAMCALPNNQILLFGGTGALYQPNLALNDTWLWTGSVWQQLGGTRPPARFGHAMTFDTVRNRVVLAGGTRFDALIARDTWEWDGTSWSQRGAQITDAFGFGLAMAFDPARGKTVMVGGATPSITKEWNGSSWNFESWIGPIPLVFGRAVYFPRLGGVAFIGGDNFDLTVNQTSIWNGVEWNDDQVQGDLPARAAHAASYDPFNRRIVFTGGENGSEFADTWVLSEFALADFNRDGVVDFFDYLDFVNDLAALNPAADFNGDGVVNLFDYLDFVDAFGSGC